ncbi:MAG: hypothetical protein CRN43_01415 [Candidatus Nephrothrix sp. EaCA]|nr:MAG: hypothetical protein CRN43_01415 [Candidatus Nephrothrix sp. EaCA]
MIKPAFPHATLSRHPRRGILIMVNDKTLKISFLIREEALTIVSASLEERPLNACKSAASPNAMCLPK